MPLLYANLTSTRRTINELGTDFKTPKGQVWRMVEMPTASQSSFKIRAWDTSTKDDHKCWIMFEASEVDRGTVVEASICQKRHYVGKMLNAALDTLISLYGHPPRGQTEQTTSPGPAPVDPAPARPAPVRPSIPPRTQRPAVRPKLHPAFQKRPPNQR